MATPTLKYVAPTTPEDELSLAPEPVVIYGVPSGGGGGSTAWADITGKPSTFPPSAHTQAISTITGLQAELDSKATPDEIPTTPGGIGAATAAQGALADTAVQPAAIANFVPNTRTVAGKALTADVTLEKGDVGLGNVDNTADSAKPVSTATQTALDAKVDTYTEAPVQDGSGWYQHLKLTSYSTGGEDEPFFVEGFRDGASRRAFWLNENGTPRGASVNSEPALKLFGPDADDAYNGLLFQIQKRYGLQTHRFGVHADGRFRIGSNQTPASPGVVVLEAADAVPTGLPAGTVIVRKP